MNTRHITMFFCMLMLVSVGIDAQTDMWVRGTITAFDGKALSVKSREGKDLIIVLAENAAVSFPKALTLADLKPGVGLGTSAVKRADGKLEALEVHAFPPEREVPNEGHRPWDLQPESTMTNALVSAMVEGANGRELPLIYPGGTQKLLVLEGVPIVMAVPGDRSLLKSGEYVYAAVEVGTDGKMTTQRLQVSKDGVKPPQ